MKEVKRCPRGCIDGRLYDVNKRDTFNCPFCRGWGVVTPKDICNCGRTCTDELEGIAFCGIKDCFDTLKRERRFNYSGYIRPDVSRRLWEEEGIDMGVHPHRMGSTTFGGHVVDRRLLD